MDYKDTFSPVVKMTSVRMLLFDSYSSQLDIKNDFLNGILDEEVYMEQPHDCVALGESGKVHRLKKSLYILKQSLRA